MIATYNGNLYMYMNNAGLVTTLAGGGSVGGILSGYLNGLGTVATFYRPNSIAVNSVGTVYVADSFLLIRKITAAG